MAHSYRYRAPYRLTIPPFLLHTQSKACQVLSSCTSSDLQIASLKSLAGKRDLLIVILSRGRSDIVMFNSVRRLLDNYRSKICWKV